MNPEKRNSHGRVTSRLNAIGSFNAAPDLLAETFAASLLELSRALVSHYLILL